jgi:Tripartite tricarboxylate transporter TctB family
MSAHIGNIVFAAILFLFGIIYYCASVDIPSNMLEDPVGASGFPRLVAALVIGLSVIILVQSVTKWRGARTSAGLADPGRADDASVDDETGSDTFAQFRKSAILFLTVVVFLVLFDIAGYAISVALLLLAVFLLNGTRFGWMPVMTAILGAICFHLFFGELLGVRLPAGILPLPF